jgi:hypothetical protein
MTITPPPRPAAHPDRFLDAQEAIESAVLDVVDQAVSAGWGEVEAVAAIVAIAENRMLAIGENELLNRQIEDLRTRHPR